MDEMPFWQQVERSLIKTYRKSIWSNFTRAVKEYQLVLPGDRICVCISGGKDSMLLAKLMQELQAHGPVDFELRFLVMDPGYSKQNRKKIEDNAQKLRVPIEIFESDIFAAVTHIENSPCYLCARMRRGHLYAKAKEMGCNKIALGHHFDDVIETVVMGMLYGAQIQTMMPKLHASNFEGMELIRPLYCVREKDIIAWAKHHKLEFLQCACHFTEQLEQPERETTSKRKEVKELIATLEQADPQVPINIFRSTHRVNLSTMLGYHKDAFEYYFLDDYDHPGQLMLDQTPDQRSN